MNVDVSLTVFERWFMLHLKIMSNRLLNCWKHTLRWKHSLWEVFLAVTYHSNVTSIKEGDSAIKKLVFGGRKSSILLE